MADAKHTIETVFRILMDNHKDIEDIVVKLGGIGNLLSLAPDLFRLWKTATEAVVASADPRAQAAELTQHLQTLVLKRVPKSAPEEAEKPTGYQGALPAGSRPPVG